MPETKDGRAPWRRLASLGFEFFAAILLCVLIGQWIDRHYGTGPAGTLIGASLGIIGGLYQLIRSSYRAFEKLDRPASEDDSEDTGREGEAAADDDGRPPDHDR